MKKEFTANILFLIGINLLIKPFYALVIDTSVQNLLGPESYGLFLAIFNFVYIQQIFADLGVQNYNNRSISRDPSSLTGVLPKILASKVLFTFIFIVITILISYIFDYLKYFNEILVWIILSQASLSFLLYLRTNLSGLGKYFTDSIVSILDKLILIVWISYLIWLSPSKEVLTVSYFAKIQFISIASTLLIVLLYTHTKILKLRIRFEWEFTKDLLRKSLPYASLVLLMAGYSRMDGIMLEKLLDDNALSAGEYARSFRLYDTLNNFTFLFAVLLLPMFSKLIKAQESVKELVSWSFKLISLGSIFSIITVYFLGSEIMLIFYPDHSEGFQTILMYLMIAGFALSLNYIYGTLLTANGSIKNLNIIALTGFTLNIIVNFFLIPGWLGEGAALATLMTQFLVLVLQIVHSYQLFDLRFSIVNATKLFIVGLACFFSYYLSSSNFDFGLLSTIILSAVVTFTIAIIIRLVSYKDFIPSFHTFAK